MQFICRDVLITTDADNREYVDRLVINNALLIISCRLLRGTLGKNASSRRARMLAAFATSTFRTTFSSHGHPSNFYRPRPFADSYKPAIIVIMCTGLAFIR